MIPVAPAQFGRITTAGNGKLLPGAPKFGRLNKLKNSVRN
jgi:hypothetical protein